MTSLQQPPAKATLPLWENALFVLVVLSSAAYAVMCAIHIYALNSLVHIFKDDIAGNPPTRATVTAKVNFEDHVNTLVTVTFWVMYVLFIGWMLGLNSRFRQAGMASAFRKTPAWTVWRVGLIVSLIVFVAVRTNNDVTSLSDGISQAHKDMGFLVVRGIIGCLYIWCAFSMRQAARSLRANATVPGVYPQVQQMPYPTATDSAPYSGPAPYAGPAVSTGTDSVPRD